MFPGRKKSKETILNIKSKFRRKSLGIPIIKKTKNVIRKSFNQKNCEDLCHLENVISAPRKTNEKDITRFENVIFAPIIRSKNKSISMDFPSNFNLVETTKEPEKKEDHLLLIQAYKEILGQQNQIINDLKSKIEIDHHELI